MPVEPLSFRRASAHDTDRIAEIVAQDPAPDKIGLAGGNTETARRLGLAWIRSARNPATWERSVVAVADERTVGVIVSGVDTAFRLTAPLVLEGLRVLGPVSAVRLLPRFLALRRATPRVPAGSYYIVQITVDAAQRGRGIGGALLDEAEAEARAGGYSVVSLITTTVNPARRLYERHGFRVVETKTDAAYKRYTDVEGRHLMVKELP